MRNLEDIPKIKADESIKDWLDRLEKECPDLVKAAEHVARNHSSGTCCKKSYPFKEKNK